MTISLPLFTRADATVANKLPLMFFTAKVQLVKRVRSPIPRLTQKS